MRIWYIVLCVVVMSCVRRENAVVRNIDQDLELSYFEREIQPIFTRSCGNAGCHIGDDAGNVKLDSYSRTMESVGLKLGRTVLPRNPSDSPLIRVVIGRIGSIPQMPLSRPPLNESDIQKLRDWIQRDALEDYE